MPASATRMTAMGAKVLTDRTSYPLSARRASSSSVARGVDVAQADLGLGQLGQHGGAVLGAVERAQQVDARLWNWRCST